MDNQSVTVSQINRYINNKMKLDEQLIDLDIRGEISNYKTYPAGHSYFTLKDEESQLSCVFFSGYKYTLKFEPQSGMKVIAHGNIQVYEKTGRYQLYVRKLTEDGQGALHIAYEQLKKKLNAEGLFDEEHKKPIPEYPKKIGVVTASTGAAIRDIITTIKRRYPLCEVLVFSTLVQGDLAAPQIVQQIKNAQNYDLDTLIVGRGGGSIEDLWPFNDERVARAIYASEIPVISAVGHEIDWTISDYVADLRAATPTAAAERAVPDIKELQYKVNQYNTRINNIVIDKINENRVRLEQITSLPLFKNPERMYDVKRMDLDFLINKFELLSKKILEDNKKKLFKLENSIVLKNPEEITKSKKDALMLNVGKLEVLNPLKTLQRGYSITKHNNKIITSVKDVNMDDELDIEFDDGIVHTKVI